MYFYAQFKHYLKPVEENGHHISKF